MIYPICAIRDAKTQFYPPMIHENEVAAIRQFGMLINNSTGAENYAPGDFDMYVVGSFDSEKGVITPEVPIRQLVSGLEVFGAKYEK